MARSRSRSKAARAIRLASKLLRQGKARTWSSALRKAWRIVKRKRR